jgi:transposase
MQPEHPLAFLFPGLAVLDLHIQPPSVTLTARATSVTACCPRCGTESEHVHSYYTRRPRDLPIIGSTLRLLLHVRRWRCLNPDCIAKTFSEPLPGLLAPTAQRTLRLTTTLQDLGLALGGEAGARQSQRQAMPTSPDTLLRLTRQIALPECVTPRVLAVDDFAFRKGRSYGTLLVNGENHHPVDLLPERSATSLSTWLREHPGVELITRDRATEYARGATDGAPHALQVLDRWHLIGNLQEAMVRLLDRLRSQLQGLLNAQTEVGGPSNEPQPLSIYERDLRRGTKDQLIQQQGRARRYALYAEVKALHRQGLKILQIAHKLEISRQTVRTYISSDHFPERSPKPHQPSILDPYAAYLQERWNDGCRANKELYAELVALGYRGSLRPLVQWTMLRRDHETGDRRLSGRKPARQVEVFVASETAPTIAKGTRKLPGSQSLAWLLLQDETPLPATKQPMLEHLKKNTELTTAWRLAQQFLGMVRNRRPEELMPWLEACLASGIRELVTFAVGLQREVVNVRAAVELPWSNGVAEGNVTRLKQIRRAMYGRGNFDLLRVRVLAAA